MDTNKNLDSFMTPREVSQYIKASLSTLYKMRLFGGGPYFVQLNKRIVRYRKSDVDNWLAAQKSEKRIEI